MPALAAPQFDLQEFKAPLRQLLPRERHRQHGAPDLTFAFGFSNPPEPSRLLKVFVDLLHA